MNRELAPAVEFFRSWQPSSEPESPEVRDRAAMFGALAGPLLMSPPADEEAFHVVGRERAVLVWRHLVTDLTEYELLRGALLRIPSCRYWLRRLAAEAEAKAGNDEALVAGNDPVWPRWNRLAPAIRRAELSEE
jgi:hypothetical protein